MLCRPWGTISDQRACHILLLRYLASAHLPRHCAVSALLDLRSLPTGSAINGPLRALCWFAASSTAVRAVLVVPPQGLDDGPQCVTTNNTKLGRNRPI